MARVIDCSECATLQEVADKIDDITIAGSFEPWGKEGRPEKLLISPAVEKEIRHILNERYDPKTVSPDARRAIRKNPLVYRTIPCEVVNG